MSSDPNFQESVRSSFAEVDEEATYLLDIAEMESETTRIEQATEQEPTTATEGLVVEKQSSLPRRQPFPPIELKKQSVSGRYRSAGGLFELELRVDIDGRRPMKRLSGDYFRTSGLTSEYFGSFVVNALTVSVTRTTVTIQGTGSFTWTTGAPKIKVTIPRRTILQPPAAATVQWFTTAGSPGATYVCPFLSGYFRTVQWEQDYVKGTVPFVSYDTGTLPQPPASPSRVLSVVAAYAEAGIEMQTAGTVNQIDTSAAGTDAKWDDSELHNAMVANFSLWKDIPQWKVYLMVSNSHVGGYRGIMFDYSGTYQRQGCAVFYDAIKGSDPASQRAQLRTYVHELGHCFNLLHSWQKDLADPPAPLGPNGGLGDLSWMNYAWKYQPPAPATGGEAAYWASFPFEFTANEIVHLRHAFYRSIILGGNAFGTGAAEIDPDLFADRSTDYSGLRLDLKGKSTFALGEPVVVEVKLSTTDLRGKRVNPYLHPKESMVQIAIRKPSGQVILYRPLIENCVDEEKTVVLNADRPAIYDSAYIGYGKDGFYFDQPGSYQLRAIYIAPDGSRVVSPTFKLRVRAPYTLPDEEVAELLMGDEQGQLFYLLGSDSEALKSGNEAFSLVLDKHAKHPLAVYASLVRGMNAGRDFKQYGQDRVVTVRRADAVEGVAQLSSVAEMSATDMGVDNITLNMVIRNLATVEAKAGDLQKAEATLDRMPTVFKRKNLKQRIIDQIEREAEVAKVELAQFVASVDTGESAAKKVDRPGAKRKPRK